MEAYKKYNKKNWRGTSLIEVVIAVGIFSMIGLMFAQTFALATAHVADARTRSGAIAVATQQMEQLRNLSYDDVAVQGGVPNGTIDPDQYVTLGAKEYRVITDIRYVDDPDDGTIDDIPADTLPTDYKIVQIDVTWDDASPLHRVRLVSQFVPPGIEQASGGGTMVINVFDANGAPLEDAQVRIVNTGTVPQIDITTFTDASGRLLVPGAPAASDYAITVSKDGYETVQTYPPYPTSTFYPNDRHMTVNEGLLTVQSLLSSKLSDVTLSIQDPLGQSISNEDVQVIGGRVLGVDASGDDVFALDQTYTSDAQGRIVLDNREVGTYTVQIPSSDRVLFAVEDSSTAGNDSFAISQGTSSTVNIIVADATEPSAIVSVIDGATGSAVAGASVNISGGPSSLYDATDSTNIYGDAYFPRNSMIPFLNGTYTLTVTAPGYAEHSRSIVIDNLTELPVALTAL